jgi:hypothetical protein
VRNPLPPNLPQEAASAHLSFLLAGIALFAVTAVVLSAAIATALVMPYAFVIARHPQRRFWGERAPLGRVMLWLAAVFVPLGLLLGVFAPQPQTELSVGPDVRPSVWTPHPAPTRGR